MRPFRKYALLTAAIGLLWACPFDNTLREYLDARFWLPFSRKPHHFEKSNIRRVSVPYAGMTRTAGESPLARLRTIYQQMSTPTPDSNDRSLPTAAVAQARADSSLTRREQEEVDLIDAKIDMRGGQPGEPQLLLRAQKKFEAFLRTARTPEFLSEARGWLAHIHYLMGDQTAAGKIYLDELNRNGSNLSRETLLDSLQMTYGYDGGPALLEHLEEYFDTPEHAAFAIQLVTNPHWGRRIWDRPILRVDNRQRYQRVKALLEKHADLLRAATGPNALALLGMRTELNMGDPAGALQIAAAVPAESAIRTEPDFQWMFASAEFLTRDYAAAEAPLLGLFRSRRATSEQQAAAAYALCGVYQKLRNVPEQLRFALWLHATVSAGQHYDDIPRISDMTVYWASSGWDLNFLLEAEAPMDVLEAFIKQNPGLPDIRLVRYSLAVRLTRENRYEEAARIYQSIHAVRRAPRILRLAELSKDTTPQGRYLAAEFITRYPNGIYYNDALWNGYQSYVFTGSTDSRLTRAERQATMDNERRLKDQQEERWRAWLILRDVIRDTTDNALRRKAAVLAIHCLDGISERFARRDDIRKATTELLQVLGIPPARLPPPGE